MHCLFSYFISFIHSFKKCEVITIGQELCKVIDRAVTVNKLRRIPTHTDLMFYKIAP